MSQVAVRLAKLEASRPVPTLVPRFDLSWLTDEEFDWLDRLRERILAEGPEGLTPDEQMEAAELRRLIEVEP